MTSYADRLLAALEQRGPLCVGIDPHAALLARWGLGDDVAGLERLALTATEAIAPVAAVIKPQVAFFERFGAAGMAVLERVIAAGREAGAIVIVDAKRGDIGATMQAYADAFLTDAGPLAGDAVTVSPYLGYGSLAPALAAAATHDRGVFVLALTSNPEGASVQRAVADGRSVGQHMVDRAAADNAGATPMGRVGLVIGATVGELGIDIAALNGPVLVPGFGAQGGTPADIRRLFGARPGIIASTSRGVLAEGPDPAALAGATRRTADTLSGRPKARSAPDRRGTRAEGTTMATSATRTPATTDFYRHVNEQWLHDTELPDDHARYGTFHALRDASEAAAREILTDDASTAAAAGSPARKIADLYASFMAADAVEARGAADIVAALARVDAVADVAGLVRLIAERDRTGGSGAFAMFVGTDPADPDSYVVSLLQGGLGLPDKSYYEDDSHADIRTAYVAHIETMLTLAGLDGAADRAGAIVALETEIAAAHWTRVDSRDRDKTYNRTDRAALDALASAVDWSAYIDGVGAGDGAIATTVVYQPSFFAALSSLLSSDRLPQWKDWLRWKIVHDLAPYSPKAFVDANFDFYGTTLTGTPELRERWKRGVGVVEESMNEALGQVYVDRHFPRRARERMDTLVAHLIAAYRQSITGLDWMSPPTRERALDKLARFTPKIGFPKRWRDYAALEIDPADLVGNVGRAAVFETARQLAKLGQPVDRDEWLMSPQTVNAYYNPGQNEIVFPAAILQPPFFDAAADAAANYGAIGAVIGHEIGHGFDDQGSKYDGTGALRDWWTDEDRAAFEALTRRLIDQYTALESAQAPGQHLNGALTIGENIGDVGGLGIAYLAWQLSLDGAESPVLDGLTGVQRFFAAWAAIWRTHVRVEEAVRLLAVDPHSPGEYRCNQVVRNIDAFFPAYDVDPDDPMWLAPDERVRIW